jgi:alpha/beta superfamily hydrolase
VVAEVAPGAAGVAGVILVAPPLARVEPARFAALAPFGEHLLVAAGSRDEICPAEGLARLREAVPHASVHMVDGANHFFFGKLFPLGEAVSSWTRKTLSL